MCTPLAMQSPTGSSCPMGLKGVKCAACMAVCNETKHILEDLTKKHYSTQSKEKFGGHYDSNFHSKMVDNLVRAYNTSN
eukprot:9382410-Pyramimonas_sp.AAC.2